MNHRPCPDSILISRPSSYLYIIQRMMSWTYLDGSPRRRPGGKSGPATAFRDCHQMALKLDANMTSAGTINGWPWPMYIVGKCSSRMCQGCVSVRRPTCGKAPPGFRGYLRGGGGSDEGYLSFTSPFSASQSHLDELLLVNLRMPCP